jgi:hypothetical protein
LNELIDRIQKVWPCLIHALVLHNEGVDKFVEIHLEFLLAICESIIKWLNIWRRGVFIC